MNHMNASQDDAKDQFFKLPGIFWLVSIPFGLTLLTATVIAPQSVPFDRLGPIGSLARMLAFKYPTILNGIFFAAMILHVGEAIYAFKVSRSKNLCSKHVWMWTIQTLIYGMFAMKYLLSYQPLSKQK